jgi:hypothetical protein
LRVGIGYFPPHQVDRGAHGRLHGRIVLDMDQYSLRRCAGENTALSGQDKQVAGRPDGLPL